MNRMVRPIPGPVRLLLGVAALVLAQFPATGALAQPYLAEPHILMNDAAPGAGELTSAINPIDVVTGAAEALPGYSGGMSGAMNILILMTVLTVAPSLLIMCTSFTRIVIVLGLVRQALGTQTLPPSQIIVGLAMVLTFVVMGPTFNRIYAEAVVPYEQGSAEVRTHEQLWGRVKAPLRDFMFAQIDATGNWSTVYAMLEYRGVDISEPENLKYEDVDMLALVPAFILSELKTAFLIGFQVYLPFLVIDMVVSSLLISMGMMMLPPVLISLPFKLLLFVLVDGWQLIVGSLLVGFAAA